MFLTSPNRLAVLHKTAEGSQDAQEIIVDALKQDLNDVVRHEAAFLLGDLKKQGKLANPAAAMRVLIVQARADSSILVKHEAALALANFPCEESVSFLVELCAHESKEVVSSALYALLDLSKVPAELK